MQIRSDPQGSVLEGPGRTDLSCALSFLLSAPRAEIAKSCMADVKILIAGSVRGNLEGLYKRVAAVNKSNGPFDLLLCTGDFFGESLTQPGTW